MRIFVTGASGHVGGELARGLVAAGHDVRALVRDASRAPAGSKPVIGDLNDPGTFTAHLGGCDGVFLLSGYANLEALLTAARESGIGRAVLLSSGGVGLSTVDNAVVAYHRKSEEAVRASGLPWTFLRPFTFMTNSLEWAEQLKKSDEVTAPFADVPVAVVDPADIAAVAAAALTGDGHAEQVYRLTGPEALTVGQRVERLAAALGRTLTLNAQTDDEAHSDMSARMPAEYVESFFDIFVRGAYDEGQLYDGVRKASGREPRSFTDWAVANRTTFS